MIGTPSSNEMLRARRRTVGVFRRKRPYDVFSKAGSSFTSAAGVFANFGRQFRTFPCQVRGSEAYSNLSEKELMNYEWCGHSR